MIKNTQKHELLFLGHWESKSSLTRQLKISYENKHSIKMYSRNHNSYYLLSTNICQTLCPRGMEEMVPFWTTSRFFSKSETYFVGDRLSDERTRKCVWRSVYDPDRTWRTFNFILLALKATENVLKKHDYVFHSARSLITVNPGLKIQMTWQEFKMRQEIIK